MGRLFHLVPTNRLCESRILAQARQRSILSVFVAAVSLVAFFVGNAGLVRAGTGGFRYREPLSKEAIIGLTNDARMAEGLTVLAENPLLDVIAEARARDILDKQYFGHVSPTGEAASHLAQRIGYRYRMIAENLAAGAFTTNSKIVDCWMQSPGHRKNILSSRMREMGASVVKGRFNGAETWVSVQIFGLRSAPVYGQSFNSSYRESIGEMKSDGLSGEDVGEKLARMKGELDRERDFIQQSLRISGHGPREYEDLNIRVRAFNEKADRYNQLLAETKAARLVMNLRN